MKIVKAIRGAVCTKNTKEDMAKDVASFVKQVIRKNNIKANDIVSIVFSQTKDLDILNAATIARKEDVGIDITNVPLFCCQETYIRGSLPLTVRLLVTTYMEESQEPHHIYQNGAEILRKDIANK